MVRMTPAKLLAAAWKSPLARRSISSVAVAAGSLAAGGAMKEGCWAEAAEDSRSRASITYFMGESYRGAGVTYSPHHETPPPPPPALQAGPASRARPGAAAGAADRQRGAARRRAPRGDRRSRLRGPVAAHRRRAVPRRQRGGGLLRRPGRLRRHAGRGALRPRGDPPRVLHLQGRFHGPRLPHRDPGGGETGGQGAGARRRPGVLRDERRVLAGDDGRRHRALPFPPPVRAPLV